MNTENQMVVRVPAQQYAEFSESARRLNMSLSEAVRYLISHTFPHFREKAEQEQGRRVDFTKSELESAVLQTSRSVAKGKTFSIPLENELSAESAAALIAVSNVWAGRDLPEWLQDYLREANPILASYFQGAEG